MTNVTKLSRAINADLYETERSVIRPTMFKLKNPSDIAGTIVSTLGITWKTVAGLREMARAVEQLANEAGLTCVESKDCIDAANNMTILLELAEYDDN